MRRKRLIALFFALVMMVSVISCTNNNASKKQDLTDQSEDVENTHKEEFNEKEINAVVLYTQNLGSQSFVDVIDNGAKRAEQELGIKYSAIESIQVADTVDSCKAVISQGANVIIASAAIFNESLLILADEFPDVMFVSIDSDGTIENLKNNVFEVTYKEHEAAFLQGVFVALMSKTGKVAQLQGQEGGVLHRFNAGFRSGVKYVTDDDPTTVVVGFTDVNKGYETAMMLYDQGYDWLACVAGGSNLGAFKASEEKGSDKWVCGAADGQFHLMPSRIVASQIKTIDNVTYDILKSAQEGTLTGGRSVQLGLAEEGVDLVFTDKNSELLEMIPQDVIDTINELKQKIIDGVIIVPSKPEEIANFTERIDKK